MYKPRKPDVTIAEYREENPEIYETLKCIIDRFAQDVYQDTEGMGLEECMETIEKLINQGLIKPIISYETGAIYMGAFNPTTGEYETKEDGEFDLDEFLDL
jgi:hypothetical protein